VQDEHIAVDDRTFQMSLIADHSIG